MAFSIAGRPIGPDRPPYLIAELSANHNQDFGRACALVRAAAQAGADAVKLQTYRPETITLPVDNPRFRVSGGLWDGELLHELYARAMTPWEWTTPLAELARSLGIHIFSTPFDESAVDYLERHLHPPAYKVASFELTHLPLLRCIGRTNRPVILSTGMAFGAEIDEAIDTLGNAGCPEIALLHCISAYPAPVEGFNLRAIPALARRHGLATGLSDHTVGPETALGAVALGACIIEKHLKLDDGVNCIDGAFSATPAEFTQLHTGVRRMHAALGDGVKAAGPLEAHERRYRRSIFVAECIEKGDTFTSVNLRIVRPGDGLPPREWDRIIGRRAAVSLKPGDPLTAASIAPATGYAAASSAL